MQIRAIDISKPEFLSAMGVNWDRKGRSVKRPLKRAKTPMNQMQAEFGVCEIAYSLVMG